MPRKCTLLYWILFSKGYKSCDVCMSSDVTSVHVLFCFCNNCDIKVNVYSKDISCWERMSSALIAILLVSLADLYIIITFIIT